MVTAMIVPGSGLVKKQAEQEGLDRIFKDAGFDWRGGGTLGVDGLFVAGISGHVNVLQVQRARVPVAVSAWLERPSGGWYSLNGWIGFQVQLT